MSEWVVGVEGDPIQQGTLFKTRPLADPDQYADFLSECNERPTAIGALKPTLWMAGGPGNSILNYDIKIGGNSCLNGDSETFGAWAAGSRHLGGVVSLFLDGHTSFTKNSSALTVLQALSTRAGGEVVSSN